MTISVFNFFAIGIGPSSSHTVGPMKAACAFVKHLSDTKQLALVHRIQIDLYGSLALTGKGHGTDIAILNGLEGKYPDTVIPETVSTRAQAIITEQTIKLNNEYVIPFHEKTDLLFHQQELLPLHTNGMRFTVFDSANKKIMSEIYYSIGGGFIVSEDQFGKELPTLAIPYAFKTATELFTLCHQHHLTIDEIMLANEQALNPEKNVEAGLLEIANIMQACIEKGCTTPGILPGRLKVKRRAPELYNKLLAQGMPQRANFPHAMLWPTLYAMAVNEENAAGGRIVTAPTNGAAGIVPAVLTFYRHFHEGVDDEKIIKFLLTAGAIALLYKTNASISGAEVGCQGEVGVACSMAAGGLTAVLGGTLEQIENAAEMVMEHHLGMTCDPIAGLVQIPCIERNGVGAEKAIKLSYLALMEDGKSKKVSLDKVIKTMYQTGKDMMSIYKETSLGGLAANVPEC